MKKSTNVTEASTSSQHRIVTYLDEVQTHTAELQRTAAVLAADLDRTEQAILAPTFRGKFRQDLQDGQDSRDS